MIGQTMTHYLILEQLGEGGLGVGYKAEDLRLKRFVALKFLLPDTTSDPETKTRLIREAQATCPVLVNAIIVVALLCSAPLVPTCREGPSTHYNADREGVESRQ